MAEGEPPRDHPFIKAKKKTDKNKSQDQFFFSEL